MVLYPTLDLVYVEEEARWAEDELGVPEAVVDTPMPTMTTTGGTQQKLDNNGQAGNCHSTSIVLLCKNS